MIEITKEVDRLLREGSHDPATSCPFVLAWWDANEWRIVSNTASWEETRRGLEMIMKGIEEK